MFCSGPTAKNNNNNNNKNQRKAQTQPELFNTFKSTAPQPADDDPGTYDSLSEDDDDPGPVYLPDPPKSIPPSQQPSSRPKVDLKKIRQNSTQRVSSTHIDTGLNLLYHCLIRGASSQQSWTYPRSQFPRVATAALSVSP